MNDLTIQSVFETRTMTSREIANLCKKRHKYVLVDIRALLEVGRDLRPTSGCVFTESTYLDKQNKSQPMFILNFKAACFLSAKYSDAFLMEVIDRWFAAEQKLIALENEKIKALENDLQVCLIQNKQFKPTLDFKMIWAMACEAGLIIHDRIPAFGWRVTDKGKFMFSNTGTGVKRKPPFLAMDSDDLYEYLSNFMSH